MASRWVKTNCLLASAAAFWLTALSPVPAIAKGISYSLALVASVQLVQESRRLIVQDARRAALAAMNQELEQTEFALHTQQQEQALYEAYSDAPTYPPEVKQELTTSLEHLYKEPSADRTKETSTSSEKVFYLAIKSLLEVKGKTYVIEQILKMGGRQWDEAEHLLQQILEEGQRNGW
ncbi:MAG: hypothetical protein RM368_18240 [Nostoc sp. DedSLP03]|uniref:hypothetical protein n=1 Tax=Nostoc sp. DedSLP03 TaxID=3075400 RepID=UPI002AD3839C|nr:hypothetical protein [Nostoc sp. DedSLP03]MDZ7966890.1 hypothetical protein [Nostoc sp. DedSLP03]